jgi:hypothetical protein
MELNFSTDGKSAWILLLETKRREKVADRTKMMMNLGS